MEKRSRATAWVASVLETGGLCVLAYGLGLVYKPLGWVALGVLTFVWGWALTPSGQEALAKERGPEHR
jgi:hypothetical protein